MEDQQNAKICLMYEKYTFRNGEGGEKGLPACTQKFYSFIRKICKNLIISYRNKK